MLFLDPNHIPYLRVPAGDLPGPWIFPDSLPRVRRDQLAALLFCALRGAAPDLWVIQASWPDNALLKQAASREKMLIWWRVGSTYAREDVLKQLGAWIHGGALLDFDAPGELHSDGWIGPLKMELERALRELNEQSRLAQGLLSEAFLLEATGLYPTPGELLEFVNQLLELRSEREQPERARAVAHGRVLAQRFLDARLERVSLDRLVEGVRAEASLVDAELARAGLVHLEEVGGGLSELGTLLRQERVLEAFLITLSLEGMSIQGLLPPREDLSSMVTEAEWRLTSLAMPLIQEESPVSTSVPSDDASYAVRLLLEPIEDDTRTPSLRRFDALLQDLGSPNAPRSTAQITLDLQQVLPDTSLTVEQFLRAFHAGTARVQGEDLAFGRWLYQQLFAMGGLAPLWREIDGHLSPARPLRFDLLVPRGCLESVADLPFELLADSRGFFFRPSGSDKTAALLRTEISPPTVAHMLPDHQPSPIDARYPGADELFAWLSLFPGGMPERMLEPIFGQDRVPHVEALQRHHMIEQEGEHRRIRLRETQLKPARDLLERIAPERQAELMERSWGGMAEWLTGFYGLIGTVFTRLLRRAVALEVQNVLALGEQLAVTPTIHITERLDFRLGTAMLAIGHTLQNLDQAPEGIRLLEKVQHLPTIANIPYSRAQISYTLGELYLCTDHLNQAEISFQTALPIFKASNDKLGEANTLMALGQLFYRTDRLQDAAIAYQTALLIFQLLDDKLGEANIRLALGDLYLHTDDLKDAETAYNAALLTFQDIDARPGEANTRVALGDLYLRTDRLQDAEQSFLSALAVFRKIDGRLGEANTLESMGDLYRVRGESKPALDAYLASIEVRRGINEERGTGSVFLQLSRLFADLAQPERSLILAYQALLIFEKVGENYGRLLVFQQIVEAFETLEHDATPAAIFLAWHAASALNDPSAVQILPQHEHIFPPSALEHPDETARECRLQLETALTEITQSLEARGIGLMDPP